MGLRGIGEQPLSNLPPDKTGSLEEALPNLHEMALGLAGISGPIAFPSATLLLHSADQAMPAAIKGNFSGIFKPTPLTTPPGSSILGGMDQGLLASVGEQPPLSHAVPFTTGAAWTLH